MGEGSNTYVAGRHKVLYDDGESEHLLLSAEHIRWDKRPPGHRSATPPTAARAPTTPPSMEQAPQPQPSEEPAAPQQEARAATPAVAGSSGGGGEDAAVVSPTELAPLEDKAAEAARLEVRSPKIRNALQCSEIIA